MGQYSASTNAQPIPAAFARDCPLAVPISEGAKAENWLIPLQARPASADRAGLRAKSPENGNYSMNGQRLSAFSTGYLVHSELGDLLTNRKGPQLAGHSAMG
jgi:hypothetical protein